VDWEYGKDELKVIYDAGKATPEKILAIVAREGFKGKVLKGPQNSAGP
jgi:hypothetical protein